MGGATLVVSGYGGATMVIGGARRGTAVRRSEEEGRMRVSGVNGGYGAFMRVTVPDRPGQHWHTTATWRLRPVAGRPLLGARAWFQAPQWTTASVTW